MSTEPTIATAATCRLVCSESVSSASSKNASYQLQRPAVEDGQRLLLLNENTTTATIGR